LARIFHYLFLFLTRKSNANFIYERCRGIDAEPVKARELPKTMDSIKTFKNLTSFNDVFFE